MQLFSFVVCSCSVLLHLFNSSSHSSHSSFHIFLNIIRLPIHSFAHHCTILQLSTFDCLGRSLEYIVHDHSLCLHSELGLCGQYTFVDAVSFNLQLSRHAAAYKFIQLNRKNIIISYIVIVRLKFYHLKRGLDSSYIFK